MSTITTGINAKQFLIDYVRKASETYLGDLSHIPQDKLNEIPMGVARPPLEFTAECIGFNSFVAKIVSGVEFARRTPEEREAFFKSIDTFDKAKAGLEDSVNELVGALSALDDEGLAKEVATPWGATMTAFALAHTAASHMSYHDGQINYIQALYGDGEIHWG
jgi:hypothetical protein